MKIRIMDMFTLEGNEQECATFMTIWMEQLRKLTEYRENKEAQEWMKKFGNLSLAELMKREQEGDPEE